MSEYLASAVTFTLPAAVISVSLVVMACAVGSAVLTAPANCWCDASDTGLEPEATWIGVLAPMFCVTRAVPNAVVVVLALIVTLPPSWELVSISVVPSTVAFASAFAKLNENATPTLVSP